MINNTESVSVAPEFSPVAGESDRAFEAFRAYFELGPRRRYAAAARKVGVSQVTVKRWATPDQSLRDQLTALLDQVCDETQAQETLGTLNRPDPIKP